MEPGVQVRKMRHTEVKELAQDDAASKKQG